VSRLRGGEQGGANGDIAFIVAAHRGGGRCRVRCQLDRPHGAALAQEGHDQGARGGRGARGAAQVRHPARGLRRAPRRLDEGGGRAGVCRQAERGAGAVHVGGQERPAQHGAQLRPLVPLPAGGGQGRRLRRLPGAAGWRRLPARLPPDRGRGLRRLLPGPAAAAHLVRRQLVDDHQVDDRRPCLRFADRRRLRVAVAEVKKKKGKW